MYQCQLLVHLLNNNVPMHEPVNLSFLLVKLILPLDLPFLTAFWLPNSQPWVTVIKEKVQSSKVIHWTILINPKVIPKFTKNRSVWAVDMVYYILNRPLRIVIIFLQHCVEFQHIFVIFNSNFNILLEPLKMHND